VRGRGGQEGETEGPAHWTIIPQRVGHTRNYRVFCSLGFLGGFRGRMLCFVLSDSAETGEGRKMLQALFAHESLIRASRVDTFPRPSKVHVLNMVIAI
jgi:hypothetical protein